MTATGTSPDLLERAWHDPRLANVLYHNWEAAQYNANWTVTYDERVVEYARSRFASVAGTTDWPYGRSLEIGCGTGFFTLNLHAAGVLDDAVMTDVSDGMVEVAARNARGLGLDLEAHVADAQQLPYDEGEFDLVIGHAVLHHIPDVEQALRESLRVLRRGGRFVFCGEPTQRGRDVAVAASRVARWASARGESIIGRRTGSKASTTRSARVSELESVVRLHRFSPSQLRRIARRSGAVDVATATDELTTAWFTGISEGEHRTAHGLNSGYHAVAYKGWQALGILDGALLGRVVPEGLFATVCITGTKG